MSGAHWVSCHSQGARPETRQAEATILLATLTCHLSLAQCEYVSILASSSALSVSQVAAR